MHGSDLTNRAAQLALVLAILLSAQARAAESAAKPARSSILIRGADIVLKVPDYQTARARVLKLAREHGAALRDAQTVVDLTGKKHGDLLLQLDAASLDRLVREIRGVGKLYSERVQTNDQSSYYRKLHQRIGLLRQNETELLALLNRPRQMRGADILFIQYRLFQSRVEASDALQDGLDLERAADRSLLHVMLFEPEPKRAFDWGNWHAHAAYRARASFLLIARKAVTGAYFALWFAPIWIPAVVVVYFVYRLLRRRYPDLWARPS